ncbi:MAG: hypothetical protein WBD31_02120 [Rubripirellula sp.]
MLVRLAYFAIVVSTVFLAVPPTVSGQDTLSVGDHVVLDLVDKAAIKWFDFVSYRYPKAPASVPGGIGMPLEATIVAIDDNDVTVEHCAMSGRNSDSPFIITITASTTIDKLRNPSLASSPASSIRVVPDAVKRATSRHAALRSFRVDSPSKIKIRKWTPLQTAEDSE